MSSAFYEALLTQPRFQKPDKWDWTSRVVEGVKIRFGQPRLRQNFDAVLVILGGIRDTGEQYFEFAHELIAHNVKPVIIDLPGQGGSEHFLKNPHKRHSQGFEKDLSLLHLVIAENILSGAVSSEDNHKRLPLILFGHSLGDRKSVV